MNSYSSLLNPTVTHAFYQANFPPHVDELKHFPVGLEEYPEGQIPADPGPCTRTGCDPSNKKHFCFKDEIRRSEPPMWRAAAMRADPCDEFQAANNEERNEYRRNKWAKRSRCAYEVNAEMDFLYKFGLPTKRPIALSSYYARTIVWRRDLQSSIAKRFTSVPITAFYETDYVFRVPYAVWASGPAA